MAEPAAVVAEPEAGAEADEPPDEPADCEADGAAAEDEAALGGGETLEQLRSNSGVVLKVEPTMPKLGLGVTG
jgi:hypothetical protein